MVTRNIPKTESFNLTVTPLHDGTILVAITSRDGRSRSYSLPEKKLRVFAAMDTTVKDAVGFLLGEVQ